MEEHIVDPGLENFLNKELPQSKRPDFKLDEEDEVDPTLQKLLTDPITDETKNQIIQCFLSAFQTSPDTAMKIMHLFKSLDSFTEGEGRDYLDAISQADLAIVSYHIVNPYIRASANTTLRKVFKYLGIMLLF